MQNLTYAVCDLVTFDGSYTSAVESHGPIFPQNMANCMFSCRDIKLKRYLLNACCVFNRISPRHL